MMTRFAFLLTTIGLFNCLSSATAQPTFEEILTKTEAKFEPAEAAPGQTVTLKISLRLLDGWHTYPTVQPDKAAKAQTNKIIFPVSGPVVFVDDLIEPSGPKAKAEPMLGIDQILYYPGGGTWTRKAVVSPFAKAGSAAIKLKFRLLLCDKDNCLPPKNVDLEATLKIGGEPVGVEAKYKDEVEKALRK